MLEKIYTRKEVADSLGISVRTVNRLILEGEIKSVKIGRARRFTEDHVKKLIIEKSKI